jgi:hypothetical protein
MWKNVCIKTSRVFPIISISISISISLHPPLPFLPSLILSQHRLSISIAFSLLSSSHPPSSNQNPKIINHKSHFASHPYLPPNPLIPFVKVEGGKNSTEEKKGVVFLRVGEERRGRELGWVWLGIGGWGFEEKGNARGSPQ